MTDSTLPPDGEPVDPFADLEALRMKQDFGNDDMTEEVLTTIDAKKPDNQDFVRVRPGPEWRLDTRLFKDSQGGDVYMVDKALWGHLGDRTAPMMIYVAMGRVAGLFLWPVRLPDNTGRTNKWSTSAHKAAALAEEAWVQVRSDMRKGRYVTARAKIEIPDPTWPNGLLMQDLLRLAFEDRYIDVIDHPILKALRGEI